MKLYAIGSIGNDFYIVKLANKMVSLFPFSFQTFLAIISIASRNFVFSKWIQWILSLSLSFSLLLRRYRNSTLRRFPVRKNYFVTRYRALSFLLVYPLLFDKFLATKTRILLYILAC